MFVTDIRSDFYNVLLGKRVLIIANYDIDAICTTKIITNLFRYDNVMYSLVPVLGLSGMRRAFNDNKATNKYVLLINCGGCIDVVEHLDPEEDVTIFICDSHRPTHVANIYKYDQVKILSTQTEEENIPSIEFAFSDDEDEEEDYESDENEAGASNRIEHMQRAATRRRERRDWAKKQKDIMFEYQQYCYYGRSSSVTIFELAWMLSKDSVELLWWAIVGITEQLVLGKIENSSYVLESGRIQSHVSRLSAKTTNQAVSTTLKITFENDLHLALYRHWTVINSLKYSTIPACAFRMWTHWGEGKLKELLAEMGLPLVHAEQTFTSMDLVLRNEFLEKISVFMPKYRLNNIVFGSFTLSHGYRPKYASSDYVYSMLGILQAIKVDRSPEYCFLEAMDTLTHTNVNSLNSGIALVKPLLEAIFKQTQLSLELKRVISEGPLLYFQMQEENAFFSYPYGLYMLAKFMVRAVVADPRNTRSRKKPLIVCCPIDVERGLSLLVAVPPISEETTQNFFGLAFRQAAANSKASILADCTETSIIQIKQTDFRNFIDALAVLLRYG